jgi:hypothetical protein
VAGVHFHSSGIISSRIAIGLPRSTHGWPSMQRRSGLRRNVRDWWQKWTVDKPAAFGDWLWMAFVVQFADFLNRLTLRRVLEIFAITVLALFFVQTFPIDLAFLFAGDILMYLEIVAVASLVAASVRVKALLQYLAQWSKNAWSVTTIVVYRMALRLRTSRQRRTKTRIATVRRRKGSNDDRPVVVWASAKAFA